MTNDKNQQAIVRQNQSGNVRQLLKDKGIINYLSTYEIMVYTQLWTDFCIEGPTDQIKKRFQAFDKIIQDRIEETKLQIDGLVID
jgi:hypothetical protein